MLQQDLGPTHRTKMCKKKCKAKLPDVIKIRLHYLTDEQVANML